MAKKLGLLVAIAAVVGMLFMAAAPSVLAAEKDKTAVGKNAITKMLKVAERATDRLAKLLSREVKGVEGLDTRLGNLDAAMEKAGARHPNVAQARTKLKEAADALAKAQAAAADAEKLLGDAAKSPGTPAPPAN